MGIYGDFHPYKIMHFISHSLPLFQGGGKENPIYAMHLLFTVFTFTFRKTVADGKNHRFTLKKNKTVI